MYYQSVGFNTLNYYYLPCRTRVFYNRANLTLANVLRPIQLFLPGRREGKSGPHLVHHRNLDSSVKCQEMELYYIRSSTTEPELTSLCGMSWSKANHRAIPEQTNRFMAPRLIRHPGHLGSALDLGLCLNFTFGGNIKPTWIGPITPKNRLLEMTTIIRFVVSNMLTFQRQPAR